MKPLFSALGLALLSAIASAANVCSLPRASVASGMTVSGVTASGVNYTARISIGQAIAGQSTSTNAVLGVGLQNTSLAGYSYFLSTGAPLGVTALPGTLSVQRLVPSANATMTLEWTTSFNALPVTYSVNTGTISFALSNFSSGNSGTTQLLTNLSYNTPYSWQVTVADQFGRTSPSAVYTFSIAPVVNHLISAPNPFHPGRGITTFMFSMNGSGSALLEIFSLPDGRRVLQRQISGLQSGVNTYDYDGRDSGGRFLGNGVFSVRLTKNGANGNAVERFKIVSVR
jgi:hypothetical protein